MALDRKPAMRVRIFVALGAAASIFVLGGRIASPPPEPVQARPLPVGVEIGRADFAGLVDRLSEPEGYFDTDNFISNETSYLHVVDRLEERVAPGGVYFGVGPDQNFSYIIHSQPSLAIIADIRRQNMLQHLLFKLLMEEASDRSDYLCRLFSKDCSKLEASSDLNRLLRAVASAPSDASAFEANLAGILRRLREDYSFDLSPLDVERMEYVYRAFYEDGLGIRFSTLGRAPSVRYPTLRELLLETDLEGRYASYLADEASFAWLQEFQRENRLIPVVGDFAGDRALPAVAAFLKERGLEVSVFYASNVEFYLFGTQDWERYLANVRAFPFTRDAVFLRAHFPSRGISHPLNVSGHRSTSLIQSVSGFLEDANSGAMRSYWDLVTRHNY